MDSPNQTADDYTPEDLELVQSGCLEMAVRFGDLMSDIVVVGGLVPALLIDFERKRGASGDRSAVDRHVGTQDLDLGFAIALLDQERYKEISRRLRRHDFQPDVNVEGNRTTHRWKHADHSNMTIDFLIPPVQESDKGGQIRNLESDFSAIIVPGLELAFEDIEHVELSGTMLNGSTVTRTLPVCGPGAFVVLKALAWRLRGAQKDAYDLFYVLRNYGDRPGKVADRLRPFLESEHSKAQEAKRILHQDFDASDAGPTAVSEFVRGHGNDEELKADVAAFIGDLLRRLD